MSEFDIKAAGWDNNPMHIERSKAVAAHIRKLVPINRNMSALEYGAGTGITSFFLADSLKHITMMDNSTAMVAIMNEKLRKTGVQNLEPVFFDLEKDDYKGSFDLIFTQMVMHHVIDAENIIKKFSGLLKNNGYLAIADLYPENGSFHGESFVGHRGFDPEKLGGTLKEYNFVDPVYMTCFSIEKEVAGNGRKNFDVFIIAAQLKRN